MIASSPVSRSRRRLVAGLAALSVLGLGADASASASSKRLDAGWTYAPARGDPRPSQPPRRGWRPVTLPHVFSAVPDERRYDGGVGWYRLRLRAPDRAPAGG